jgi:TolB-like protein
MRIGINVEDVIVDEDDLHGDGVNVAARIQQLANPGEVVVTATVRDYVLNKLGVGWTDIGERELKNISRPVRLYRLDIIGDPPTTVRGAAHSMEAWSRRPSIAVLPFRNMSGNPDENYFGEGITEDIITALSRTRSLFVIARNSTLRYLDRHADTRQIASELGVRYILEGSVRRQALRLRISSELIDATHDRTLWAERYDGANDDLFGFQDRIASSIVATIEPHVFEAEAERVRSKPTENLDAYDCLLRAMPLLQQSSDLRQWDDAAAYIDRAITLDPGYAQAHAYRGWLYLLSIGELRTKDLDADAALAKASVDRGMELDSKDAFVLSVAGHVYAFLHKELALAVQFFDRALELNENSAFAWGLSGITYGYLNQPEEALERFRRAWRLNPYDRFNFFFLVGAGLAEFVAGRYEEAIPWLRKALRHNPRFITGHRHLVTTLWHAGRHDEARIVARDLLAIYPGFRVGALEVRYPLQPRENLERYIGGLRAAGLPG